MQPATLWFLGLSVFISSCTPADRSFQWQGYVEADPLYLSAPLSGPIKQLAVTRGQRIAEGEPLFSLDPVPFDSAVAQAQAQLAQRQAELADAQRGSRPEELAVIEAQFGQAEAAARLTREQYQRQRSLRERKLTSQEQLDEARAANDQAQQRLSELQAALATARLPSRAGRVAAAEAAVKQAEATLAKALWEQQQSHQYAPAEGQIHDILLRQGETLAAGEPVVVLHPFASRRIRFYVPQHERAALHAGQQVQIRWDGGQLLTAHISFIAAEVEYTPPVIYSDDERAKLVFLVEASPAASDAPRLPIGLPVDVSL